MALGSAAGSRVKHHDALFGFGGLEARNRIPGRVRPRVAGRGHDDAHRGLPPSDLGPLIELPSGRAVEQLGKVGVQPQELSKLNKIPLLCSFVGLAVNITLLLAMSNYAWIKATALANGQPFTAYLSLGSVKFGSPTQPDRDNGYFCAEGSSHCDLGTLCAAADDAATFANQLPKNTPAEAWCQAASAGTTAGPTATCA